MIGGSRASGTRGANVDGAGEYLIHEVQSQSRKLPTAYTRPSAVERATWPAFAIWVAREFRRRSDQRFSAISL